MVDYIMRHKAPKPAFQFDSMEITQIAVSIFAICLSLTFTEHGLSILPVDFISTMARYGIIVGSAFVLHELAHKYVAIQYGCQARFEASTWGLALMLGLAIIPQLLFHERWPLILAPGAVMIYAFRQLGPKETGHISIAGPLTNFAIATVFLVSIFILPFAGLDLKTTMDIANAFAFGIAINLWLALFNLIPMPPLDGFKVLAWNKWVWLGAFIFTLIAAIPFIGLGFLTLDLLVILFIMSLFYSMPYLLGRGHG